MKKFLLMILVFCLAVIPAAVSLAEGPVTEYENELFSVTLPEGTWYKNILSDGNVTFDGNPHGFIDDGRIYITVTDYDLGNDEAILQMMYDGMRDMYAAGAVENKIEEEECEIGGIPSRLFTFKKLLTEKPIVSNFIIYDKYMIEIKYEHPGKTEEELKEVVLFMSAALKFKGDHE